MTDTKSIKNMSFEEAIAELEQIVRKIDTGSENLSESVASFERGVELKKHCEKLLKDAKLKIEKITKDSSGDIKVSDIEI